MQTLLTFSYDHRCPSNSCLAQLTRCAASLARGALHLSGCKRSTISFRFLLTSSTVQLLGSCSAVKHRKSVSASYETTLRKGYLCCSVPHGSRSVLATECAHTWKTS